MTRALVIVDVQNDFCEGGSLAVAGGAAVAAGVSAALSGYSVHSRHWDHVVATKDLHVNPGAHFSSTPDFVDSWPAHCVEGSEGSELHPNLRLSRIEAVFDKGEFTAAYSGFEGVEIDDTPLLDWLRARDVRELDIVGIATDYCVKATALDAAKYGFDTRVLLGLTAGVAPDSTQQALWEMNAADVRLVGTVAVRPRDWLKVGNVGPSSDFVVVRVRGSR